MNCSVCGKPLLFNRVAFKCSCGAYVHAYCLDQHILEAHRPEVEEGNVDLNSDFHPVKVAEPEPEVIEDAELAEEAEAVKGEVVEETEAAAGVTAEKSAEEGATASEEATTEEDESAPDELVEDKAVEEDAGAPSDVQD